MVDSSLIRQSTRISVHAKFVWHDRGHSQRFPWHQPSVAWPTNCSATGFMLLPVSSLLNDSWSLILWVLPFFPDRRWLLFQCLRHYRGRYLLAAVYSPQNVVGRQLCLYTTHICRGVLLRGALIQAFNFRL